MRRVSALLLAAGDSTRMGTPKQLLPVGGDALVAHVARALLAGGIVEVMAVLGSCAGDVERALKAVSDSRVRTTFNDRFGEGMGSSIRRGMEHTAPSVDGVLIALADNPLLDGGSVRLILEGFSSTAKGIIIPTFEGRRGHPVLFAARYFPALMRLRGDVGGRSIVTRHKEDVLEIAMVSGACLVNLNTPADWENYLNAHEKEKRIFPGNPEIH